MAKGQFRKKNGSRCTANAQPRNGLCVFHDPTRANDGRRARRAGGLTRSRSAATLPSETADYPLSDSKNVAEARKAGYLCAIPRGTRFLSLLWIAINRGAQGVRAGRAAPEYVTTPENITAPEYVKARGVVVSPNRVTAP